MERETETEEEEADQGRSSIGRPRKSRAIRVHITGASVPFWGCRDGTQSKPESSSQRM